jgi:hypothetical protein
MELEIDSWNGKKIKSGRESAMAQEMSIFENSIQYSM